MKKNLALATAALCAATSLLPLGASAQMSDKWEFQGTLYGWFPTIGGSTVFPEKNGGSSVTMDADAILSDLKFVFMGALEARKGRWGAFTDVVYMDLGDTKSGTRELSIDGGSLPADVSARATYDLKGWAWTIAGTYRLASDPALTMDVLGGVRMLDIETTLGWELSGNVDGIPTQGRQGQGESNLTNWDAIIGVKGRYAFGAERRWFAPYYLDVGTGDSDLTWQAMGGLGYRFSWGDIVGVWRYLDYDMKSGDNIKDINFNGPAIAVSFRW